MESNGLSPLFEVSPPRFFKPWKIHTAVVFIDPQNDVLSEKGANWGAVDASVTENPRSREVERDTAPISPQIEIGLA
jgi:hypothetical protein